MKNAEDPGSEIGNVHEVGVFNPREIGIVLDGISKVRVFRV